MLVYPTGILNTKIFPARVYFNFFERFSTTSSAPVADVALYMPENFSQPSTVNWDCASLADEWANFANRGIDMLSNVKGLGGVVNFAQAVRNVAATDLQNTLQTVAGAVPNPYIAQIFRGVDLRQFNFTFKLVPFSEKDCDTILDIIKTFRKYALPVGSSGGTSPYLKYPGEVEIEYQFEGSANKYLHKFKRSVITALEVNYTGAGMWGMMRNGFPAETVLDVQLSELSLVLRGDIEQGF